MKLTKVQQIDKIIGLLSESFQTEQTIKAVQMLESLQSQMVKQNPNQNNEWGTPIKILDLVHDFYGDEGIWLDPASSEAFAANVKAKRYFTVEDNALEKFWGATTLFCNPPYGKLTKPFLYKCISSPHVEEAIFLVNRTGAAWYVDMFDQCYWTSICNVKKRIAFVDENGIVQPSPRYYNDILYHGIYNELFEKTFSVIGNVRRLHDIG